MLQSVKKQLFFLVAGRCRLSDGEGGQQNTQLDSFRVIINRII